MNGGDIFTNNDILVLQKHKKSIEDAHKEYNLLLRGAKFVPIVDAATVQNRGIKLIDEEFERIGQEVFENKEVLKFIPASGQASRMFKHLMFEQGSEVELEELKIINKKMYDLITQFVTNIDKFPFYSEIKEKINLESSSHKEIIKYILSNDGLNYKGTPKGLISYHEYSDKTIDALEEQIIEGKKIGYSKYHFTVAKEHLDKFEERKKNLEEKYNVKISLSIQESKTHTISINPKTNQVFRDENKNILLRPGGHGALLHNLEENKTDYVFLKNIDNVAKEKYHDHTVIETYKLFGYLESLKNEIHELLDKILSREITGEKVISFIKEKLPLKLPEQVFYLPNEEQLGTLYNILNKPIKVCQMVENQGEPGGGPTWVKSHDGLEYLRITEQAECEGDKDNKYMKNGTHFNPVGLGMYLRNHKGENFNLHEFANWESCFIAEKSYNGEDIRCLEHPGLWNGATEGFLTIFVEAPIEIFNPVKTVNDLLRPGHQD